MRLRPNLEAGRSLTRLWEVARPVVILASLAIAVAVDVFWIAPLVDGLGTIPMVALCILVFFPIMLLAYMLLALPANLLIGLSWRDLD